MNGIDISGHQQGIDLAKVPCDFVIIKATQGTSFVSKDFTRQITQALSLGKLVGVYHYATGADIDSQANHFKKTISPYLGQVLIALDWEGQDNSRFSDYRFCENLLETIKEKTEHIPFLYMSKSVARQYKWERGRNYPFWCAQYANYDRTGYKTNPWTDDKGFGPWGGCKIFQYSSKGRLDGYNKDLDLDIAYMTADEWNEYAGKSKIVINDDDDDILAPTLRKGDRNEYVRSWQTYLNAHGYDVGKAGCDGVFGDATEKAVVKYQQDHGIEAGYIGKQTWATIK